VWYQACLWHLQALQSVVRGGSIVWCHTMLTRHRNTLHKSPLYASNALHTSAPAAIHCIRAHPIVRATAPRRNTQRQAWQGGQQDEGLLVLSQHPHGVLVLPLRLHQHGMLLLPLSRTSSSARRCSDQGEATQVRETGAPTRKRGGLPEKSRAPRSITRRTNLCKVGGVRRNCGV